MSFRKYCKVFCQRLISLKTFLFQKTYWGRHNNLFIEYLRPFTATASHHHYFMTTRYSVPRCFDVNCLDVLTYRSNDLRYLKAHPQSRCYMHPIRVEQTAWLLLSRPRMLVCLKATFLENYLAIRTWILNGSSIKCHERKYQLFSLSGVSISKPGDLNFWVKICLALERSKMSFPPLTPIITCSKSQHKPIKSLKKPWDAKVL